MKWDSEAVSQKYILRPEADSKSILKLAFIFPDYFMSIILQEIFSWITGCFLYSSKGLRNTWATGWMKKELMTGSSQGEYTDIKEVWRPEWISLWIFVRQAKETVQVLSGNHSNPFRICLFRFKDWIRTTFGERMTRKGFRVRKQFTSVM